MRSACTRISLVLSMTILSSAALAQTPATSAAAKPVGAVVAQTKSGAPQVETAQIAFEGGTLTKYKEHLETKFANPNIIIDSDVGQTILPPAHLRVSLVQALHWVSGTADARNRHVTLQTTNGVHTFTTMQPQAARAADTVVKTYAQLNPDGSWTQPTGAALKEALSGLLERRDSNKRGVDFDERTQLLIVTGTRSDIQIADQVIEELTRGRRAAAALTSVQAEINRLNARISSLETQLAEIRKTK